MSETKCLGSYRQAEIAKLTPSARAMLVNLPQKRQGKILLSWRRAQFDRDQTVGTA
jgi:hypothetical protein